MTEQNDKEHPRSRVRKGSKSFVYIAVLVVILFAVGCYFYVQKNPFSRYPDDGDSAAISEETHGPSQLKNPEQPAPLAGAETLEKDPSIQGGEASQEGKDTPTQSEEQPSGQGEYQYLIDELNIFYTHLDQQPYMQAFALEEPSKVHFSKVLQKLVDNPPVVTRETDDLFTLLKNTAHFFRILGKDNIIILKGILDREKESFEQILKTFYSLTYHPEYLKKEYALTIPFDALYDYAGFFLNTMGGRLYLFRRDSTSRLAVSYYAILVIDRANDEGNSHHGIDLKPAIDSLIEEIENGGKRLRLKEEYLDKLYDLKEKYD